VKLGFGESFQTTGSALAYERGQYAPGSYWDVVWQIEKSLLHEVVDRLRTRKAFIEHLDFACGTGRVLAEMEPRCDLSVGIDVSAEMLEVARTRVVRARILRTDITAPGALVEGRYDLVTAFRFLLNAPPDLRVRGLEALARRLRDPDSILVVNLHGNLRSYKALLAPFRWARSRVFGHPAENLLRPGQVASLLRAAGLEILDTRGMGILPGTIVDRIPDRYRVSVERQLARWFGPAGVNQVFVCRRAFGATEYDARTR
jgi:SAM-dependent methyltransferase